MMVHIVGFMMIANTPSLQNLVYYIFFTTFRFVPVVSSIWLFIHALQAPKRHEDKIDISSIIGYSSAIIFIAYMGLDIYWRSYNSDKPAVFVWDMYVYASIIFGTTIYWIVRGPVILWRNMNNKKQNT